MVSRISFFILSLGLMLWQPPQAPGDTTESRSLSLQEAIATALAQHPTLRIEQTTIEAAQARVRQQVAGYLPRGAYTYTYTRQERPSTSTTGGGRTGVGIAASIPALGDRYGAIQLDWTGISSPRRLALGSNSKG